MKPRKAESIDKHIKEECKKPKFKKQYIKERLCLLCRKYMSVKNWKRHLRICEPKFRKERGIVNAI